MQPLLLISNDDGISAFGLSLLARSLSGLGEILVTAPETDQSSMGRSYPKHDDVGRYGEVAAEDYGDSCIAAYAINGSASQVAAYSVLSLAHRKPNIALIGFNHTPNLGRLLTSSSSLGAAFEYASFGIPSVCISLALIPELAGNPMLVAATKISRAIAKSLLKNGLPDGATILNVNFPALVESEAGLYPVRVSRQELYYYEKLKKPSQGKLGKLETKTHIDIRSLEQDSDIAAQNSGMISVSMLTDNLDATRSVPESTWKNFCEWVELTNTYVEV